MPSLELEADTTVAGTRNNIYSIAPVLFKGLTPRGHIAMAVGAKIPVADADPRPFDYQIGAFLLWESMDGGIWW